MLDIHINLPETHAYIVGKIGLIKYTSLRAFKGVKINVGCNIYVGNSVVSLSMFLFYGIFILQSWEISRISTQKLSECTKIRYDNNLNLYFNVFIFILFVYRVNEMDSVNLKYNDK